MQVHDKEARGREAALRSVDARRRIGRQCCAISRNAASRVWRSEGRSRSLASRLRSAPSRTIWLSSATGSADCGGTRSRSRDDARCFTPKDTSQDVRGFGRLCSEGCKRRKGGLVAATRRHRLADKELERTNADGYLTLRQAAEKLRIGEATIHRYIGLGHIEVAERRRCHGEQWTLSLVRVASARAREPGDHAQRLRAPV
jgi:hypothetical protein